MGVFIISLPNFGIVCFLYLVLGILFFTLPFFGPWHDVYSGKNPTVFLLFGSFSVCSWSVGRLGLSKTIPNRKTTGRPQKGAFKGAVAGNSSLPN
jgi:hypothetical protein